MCSSLHRNAEQQPTTILTEWIRMNVFRAGTRWCSRFVKGQLSNFYGIWVSSGCEAERLQCASDCEPLLRRLQPVACIDSSFRSWKSLLVLSYVFCHHHSPHWQGRLSTAMSLAVPSAGLFCSWISSGYSLFGQDHTHKEKSTFTFSIFFWCLFFFYKEIKEKNLKSICGRKQM